MFSYKNQGNIVIVQPLGSSPKSGVIIELWKGSIEEQMSGHYGLDKYHIRFDDGNNGWYYGNDIKLIGNAVIPNTFYIKKENIYIPTKKYNIKKSPKKKRTSRKSRKRTSRKSQKKKKKITPKKKL